MALMEYRASTNHSRRDLWKLLLAGLPLSKAFGASEFDVIGGIQFGIESFSFHDLPRGVPDIVIPKIIQYMKVLGLTEVEPVTSHIEPFGDNPSMRNYGSREDIRRWRLTVPLSFYHNIRQQFENAGMRIMYYDIVPGASYTDAEIDRTFEAAKALGAIGLGSSIKLDEAQRLVPFAEKHKMIVAMHNHNSVCDPNELATPESLERGLAMSKQFMINLDLGHYAAGNNDSIDFIRKHHDRVAFLHVRDRKRNAGRYVPNGKGDGKVAETLRYIRDNKYPIRAYIEYEYGTYRTPLEEIGNALQFCKDALSA